MVVGEKLLGTFRTFPCDLYRVQRGMSVKLRELQQQLKKNSLSYDFELQPDKLIHPIKGDVFTGPNGMSLRPGNSPVFAEVLSSFRGDDLFCIPKGTVVPDQLILYHEHTDHYSLQTAVPCTPKELNERMTQFLSNMKHLTKQEYFKQFPISRKEKFTSSQ